MKTFFLDIDGVIYKDNAININVIKSILKSNNNIIFCTGRGYLRTVEVIKNFSIKDLITIIENGAQIIINDKKIFSKTINVQTKQVLKKIDTKCIDYVIFASLNTNLYYSYSACSKKLNHVENNYDDIDEFFRKLVLEEVGQITLKLVDKSYSKQLLDICKENNIEVKLSEDYFIINSNGVSKKRAVEFIINSYKLNKEDIIVVGNDKNDLEMFDIKCTKIAVVDQYTPQELIDKATFCSNFKSLETVINRII